MTLFFPYSPVQQNCLKALLVSPQHSWTPLQGAGLPHRSWDLILFCIVSETLREKVIFLRQQSLGLAGKAKWDGGEGTGSRSSSECAKCGVPAL